MSASPASVPVIAAARRPFLRTSWLELLILPVFVSVVFLRFFTETIQLLPSSFQQLDYLAVVILYLGAATIAVRRTGRLTIGHTELIIGLFVLISIVSSLMNFGAVSLLQFALYVSSFVMPLLIVASIQKIRTKTTDAVGVGRLFIFAAVVQCVVSIVQIAAGLRSDGVTGTFGYGNNQFAVTLVIGTNVVLAVALMRRKLRLLLVLLVPASVFVLMVASVRLAWGLWPAATALSLVLLLGPNARTMAVDASRLIGGRLTRRFGRTLFVSSLLGGLLTTVALVTFTFGQDSAGVPRILNSFTAEPRPGRIDFLSRVPDALQQRPTILLIGTGPGTLLSRTWQITVAEGVAPTGFALQMGRPSTMTYFPPTGLAERYTLGYYTTQAFTEGWANNLTDTPSSSILSAAFETGPFSLVLLLLAYAHISSRLVRLGRVAHSVGEPWYFAAAFGALTGFIYVGLISLISVQGEVNRITFPAAILAGVVLASARRSLTTKARGDG